jgi:hypothetical protein
MASVRSTAQRKDGVVVCCHVAFADGPCPPYDALGGRRRKAEGIRANLAVDVVCGRRPGPHYTAGTLRTRPQFSRAGRHIASVPAFRSVPPSRACGRERTHTRGLAMHHTYVARPLPRTPLPAAVGRANVALLPAPHTTPSLWLSSMWPFPRGTPSERRRPSTRSATATNPPCAARSPGIARTGRRTLRRAHPCT